MDAHVPKRPRFLEEFICFIHHGYTYSNHREIIILHLSWDSHATWLIGTYTPFVMRLDTLLITGFICYIHYEINKFHFCDAHMLYSCGINMFHSSWNTQELWDKMNGGIKYFNIFTRLFLSDDFFIYKARECIKNASINIKKNGRHIWKQKAQETWQYWINLPFYRLLLGIKQKKARENVVSISAGLSWITSSQMWHGNLLIMKAWP